LSGSADFIQNQFKPEGILKSGFKVFYNYIFFLKQNNLNPPSGPFSLLRRREGDEVKYKESHNGEYN